MTFGERGEVPLTASGRDAREIQGQYIGLMKFQNAAIPKIKSFYQKCKSIFETSNLNPLNSKTSFQNSYLTDFLQGLINEEMNLKAISIENGWLELDNINDYELYTNNKTQKQILELYDPYA